MRGVPIALRLALAAGLTCCRSDHHVSPWPRDVPLELLAQPADLGLHLRRVADEMRREGMDKRQELRASFADGTPLVVASYESPDSLGGLRHAVRVATAYGIVLAAGPDERLAPATGQRARTRLVAALAGGGGWRSGTDLNGDGWPDVVLAGEDRTLELWCVRPQGAVPYPIASIVAPVRAEDVDGDGVPELAGRVRLADDDPIAPLIEEVVGFASGEYRNDTPAVRAHHRRALERLEEQAWAQDGGTGARAGTGEPDAPKLARALERAWHARRSGQRAVETLEEADRVARTAAPLSAGVAQAWVRWRGWLGDLGR
jgi:hypothetical protein